MRGFTIACRACGCSSGRRSRSSSALVIALLFRAALLRALRGWLGASHGITAFLAGIRLPSILWCFVLGFFVAIDMVELPRRLAVPLRTILEAAIIVSITVTAAGVLELAGGGGQRAARHHRRRDRPLPHRGPRRRAQHRSAGAAGLARHPDHAPAHRARRGRSGRRPRAARYALEPLRRACTCWPIGRSGSATTCASPTTSRATSWTWAGARRGVRMLANNVVIVPNKKVAESIITNYDMPERRMSLRAAGERRLRQRSGPGRGGADRRGA